MRALGVSATFFFSWNSAYDFCHLRVVHPCCSYTTSCAWSSILYFLNSLPFYSIPKPAPSSSIHTPTLSFWAPIYGQSYLARILSPYINHFECLWVANLPRMSLYILILCFLDAIWASFWGLIYRKFFWDFIGGTLEDPGGIQWAFFLPPRLRSVILSFHVRPSSKVAVFIAIIVDVPTIQILTMALAAFILCIELPFPPVKTLLFYRSLVLRTVLLIFQACLALLFYQVRSLAKVLLYSADSCSGD